MSPSRYPDWASFEFPAAPAAGAGGDDAPVAFCADLSPASVLAAYRRGIVPMPAPDDFFRGLNEIRYEDQVADGTIAVVGDQGGDPYQVAWWSPDPRPVIGGGGVHLGRNVRKRLRRDDLVTTADTAFRPVAEACREGREPRWLTDELLASLSELHEAGWAHSIEVWRGDELAGGAMCVGVNGVLSGDSLFSRHPGAGAVAVADMHARLGAAGGTVIDAQWESPFLRILGARDVPRERYLALLGGAGQPAAPVPLPREPLPARRLLGLHPVGEGHAEQPEADGQHPERGRAQGQP
jgi:leucyl/phenylalanyl-tRNA--protein transferase